MTSETINRRREEFPTLASGIHLLSHSLGPVPLAARESMIAYCDAWEHHTSEDAWATNWWELSQLVGDRIARIIGGAPGSVQIQPNALISPPPGATRWSLLPWISLPWNTSGKRRVLSERGLRLSFRLTASPSHLKT